MWYHKGENDGLEMKNKNIEKTKIRLLEVLKIKRYALIALIFSLGMALIYPYLQVALNGGFYNYGFWFEVILSQSKLNFVLYLLFSILFGVVVSYSIYSWKHKKCGVKSLGSGGFGSIVAMLTSQCSACLSLASLFLPAAAVSAFFVYNTLFNFISIGALLLSIYLMGGFYKA